MPTVTVEGEKSFEVDTGKKLVLAIEDAGIDIMHRCGGNARCTTCRVQVLAGDAPPMEATRARAAGARNRPRAQHALSCQIRVESDLWVRRRQPRQSNRNPGRNSPPRLSRCRQGGGARIDAGISRCPRLTSSSAARRSACSARIVYAPATAPRAPVILGLPGFLLAGTEWHGTPRSNIELGFGTGTRGGTVHDRMVTIRRASPESRSTSLLDHGADGLEQAMVSTGSPLWRATSQPE